MDTPDHRVVLLGIEVSVATEDDRSTLLKRIADLEGRASQGRAVPDLLTRLDVANRRYVAIRRLLTTAGELVEEAKKAARSDLDDPVTSQDTAGRGMTTAGEAGASNA